jgi:hypothetical protein
VSMRSSIGVCALGLLGALACAACGLDEVGLEPVGSDGSTDVTLRDVAPKPTADSHAPTDAHSPDDHASHDAADGGKTTDDASDAHDHSDAAESGDDSSHPADAGKDSGKDSSGGSEGGGDSATGITYACDDGGTTTTDCLTGCSGSPVSCVFCRTFSPDVATCGKEGKACSDTSLGFGYGPCGCFLMSCVASDQICSGFPAYQCQSCGEPGTNAQTCQGGGTCDEATATCM